MTSAARRAMVGCMDDWEDPDEHLKADVRRALGKDAKDANIEVSRAPDGGSIIRIGGLEGLRGPTCKTCGANVITSGGPRQWWQFWIRPERICPTCDPDHPLAVFVRNLDW